MLPVAGDDATAKAAVTTFLDSIGYDALDAGPLPEGWRFQRDTAAYVQPYAAPGVALADSPGQQVTTATLQEKLDAAVRYLDM